MNHEQYLAYHKAMCDRMIEIARKKNHDYSGGHSHAFRNFTVVEDMGIASTEAGFLVRMSDKMSRISNFVQSGVLKVSDESIEDTLIDLANYSILMAGYIKSKKQTEAPRRVITTKDGHVGVMRKPKAADPIKDEKPPQE